MVVVSVVFSVVFAVVRRKFVVFSKNNSFFTAPGRIRVRPRDGIGGFFELPDRNP